jgi:ferrous iron transport protein B
VAKLLTKIAFRKQVSGGISTFVNLLGKKPYIALVGNPNSGKSSLFNCLTGLHQQVGNFPGVTVDKTSGTTQIDGETAGVVDLPGTYSLYPKRPDEWVSYKVLIGEDAEIRPDLVVVVADASSLKRNLLFCSQLIDLKQPLVVALSMMDLARKKGIKIDLAALERELGVPVVAVDPRKNKGIADLKKAIGLTLKDAYKIPARDFIDNKKLAPVSIEKIKAAVDNLSDYKAIHYLINHESFDLPADLQDSIENIEQSSGFNHTKTQAEEILQRYNRIRQIMQVAVTEPDPLQTKLFTEKLDQILLHRKWGYLILLLVLFLLFQSVFWLAQYPMDFIESFFANAGSFLSTNMAPSWGSDLLINGVLAGLSGILVFVPQIMILFGLITLLEDSGYMARISFLSDRLMRSVGLNGKSAMPMISGFACAVPAIMSARNIENKKERLLTILITPLMSCSARLPVYTIMIGLIIPDTYVLGLLSLRGLVMMGLYLLGLVVALLVAYIAKFFISIQEKSFFILELPTYRRPRWGNMFSTMFGKAKIFVVDAGKIIMIISLLLWGLSSFGPTSAMHQVHTRYESGLIDKKDFQKEKLENSFAGIIGKSIEPAIAPLGFDWKVGIALITSFAAREVFVGTMATLYSVGDEDQGGHLLNEKLKAAVRPDGTKQFTLAAGLSLLIFYVFAMQCMSTLAIVKRETKSWKWPAIQWTYMTGIAYLLSWLVYSLLK